MIPNVINFHITDACNYNCKYCFAKFRQRDLPLADAKRVVDAIADFFDSGECRDGRRINLAGGEPLLYSHFDELAEYIHRRGIGISIITNGSLLSNERIDALARYVDMLGISIDAASDEVNAKIGRCNREKPLSVGELTSICAGIKAAGMRLKINTVVSRLNLGEDMLSVYRLTRPDRLKLICMHTLGNVNADASVYEPSDGEFYSFVERNGYYEDCEVVIEGPRSMRSTYLMINPQGELYVNNQGNETRYGSCLEAPIAELYKKIPFDEQGFLERYTKRTV